MVLKEFFDQLKYDFMLRKMDYPSDQQGIVRRYLREKNGWDLHLEKSKQFIIKSAQTKNKGKALVLGSGWLLDCPIAELSSEFSEVILADIYHPKQIIKKFGNLKNIHFLNTDITGGLIEFLYNNIKSGKTYLLSSLSHELKAFSFKIPKETDFVISLNILSQLSIIIIDYLRTLSVFSEGELQEIGSIIQQKHIEMLPINKTCLICDYEEELFDDENKFTGANPLVFSKLPDGRFSEKWVWKFDTSYTYRDDLKTHFNVIAIDL